MAEDDPSEALTESEREAFQDICTADLEALYCPGFYSKGEELCVQILEKFDPDSEPALLFLVLNLAAQDQLDSALELVNELTDQSLLEALRQLAFGEGADAESALYETILELLEERGKLTDMEEYFGKRDKPIPRAVKKTADRPWQLKQSSPLAAEQSLIDDINW